MDDPIKERTDSFRELERRCRERNLPLTVQRRVVYQNLVGRDDHPGVSRATVYRVLETLVEMGLARRVEHVGPAARFDGNLRRHHHLVCSQCASISDVEDAGLRLRVPASLSGGDFRIASYTVNFQGRCARCRARTSGPTPA